MIFERIERAVTLFHATFAGRFGRPWEKEKPASHLGRGATRPDISISHVIKLSRLGPTLPFFLEYLQKQAPGSAEPWRPEHLNELE